MIRHRHSTVVCWLVGSFVHCMSRLHTMCEWIDGLGSINQRNLGWPRKANSQMWSSLPSPSFGGAWGMEEQLCCVVCVGWMYALIYSVGRAILMFERVEIDGRTARQGTNFRVVTTIIMNALCFPCAIYLHRTIRGWKSKNYILLLL